MVIILLGAIILLIAVFTLNEGTKASGKKHYQVPPKYIQTLNNAADPSKTIVVKREFTKASVENNYPIKPESKPLLPYKPSTQKSTDSSKSPYSLIALNPAFKKPLFKNSGLENPGLNKTAINYKINHNTKDFLVIDFETANTSKYSACALGIAIVKDLQIVETKHYYISPQHDAYFIQRFVSLHGITWDDVYDKPFFNEIWPEIEKLFSSNLLIAYNASFDISVLRETLNYYAIPLPQLEFTCALECARQYIKGPYNYKLSTVCQHLNISLEHHQAESDAIATAKITIYLIEKLKKEEAKIQEKNERKIKWEDEVEKAHKLKENGLYDEIQNIKKNIRRNRKLMIDNPEKDKYKALYFKYKRQYIDMMGSEYAEKD